MELPTPSLPTGIVLRTTVTQSASSLDATDTNNRWSINHRLCGQTGVLRGCQTGNLGEGERIAVD